MSPMPAKPTHFPAQLRYAADHFCRGILDATLVERARGFDYRVIGRGFLDAMRTRSRGRAFVTEKQNPNFILLGPIAKALPQARLLHMRRDPADTCSRICGPCSQRKLRIRTIRSRWPIAQGLS